MFQNIQADVKTEIVDEMKTRKRCNVLFVERLTFVVAGQAVENIAMAVLDLRLVTHI